MLLTLRRLVLFLVVLVGLGLVWSAWWLLAMTRAQDMAALSEARLAARGGAFVCGERQWSGFPLSFTLTCRGTTLALPEGAVIQSTGFEASAWAYRPNNVVAHAKGPTHLRLDQTGSSLAVDHGPIVANVLARLSGVIEGSVTTPEFAISDASGLALVGRDMRLAGVLGTSPDEAEFAASGQGLEISGSGTEPIRIETLSAEGRIERMPGRISTNLKKLLRDVARQRSRLVVESASARSGDVLLTASGAIELSPEGRLTGSLSTTVSNLKALLAELERRGLVSRKAANASLLVAGLFGGGGKNGSAAKLDLRFDDGRVYWGPILLFEHAPLL
jgi:hypothetical protein